MKYGEYFLSSILELIQTAKQTNQAANLKVKSIAQATYELISSFDSGFNSNSASEIRVKFKSRQAVLNALGEENPLFEETDSGSWCQKLNQKAIDWAEANASDKALKRYKSTGIIMKVGQDFKSAQTGPTWIWQSLSQKTQLDQDGNKVRMVRSPVMKTALDYPIKKAQGMHYCKLLSPARALSGSTLIA